MFSDLRNCGKAARQRSTGPRSRQFHPSGEASAETCVLRFRRWTVKSPAAQKEDFFQWMRSPVSVRPAILQTPRWKLKTAEQLRHSELHPRGEDCANARQATLLRKTTTELQSCLRQSRSTGSPSIVPG